MQRRWTAFLAIAVLLLSQVGAVQAGSHTATAAEVVALSGTGTAQAPAGNGPKKASDLGEAPPPESTGAAGTVGIESYTPGDQVAESDEEFVLDAYNSLDSYTFRSGGPIRFPIRITRYFGPVDGDGHLLHPENIQGEQALLTLRVWDVDQDYAGGDFAPEVDQVTLNGNPMGTLTGSNGQWSTFSVAVPVSQLKFPELDASGGVIPAENWVQVDIDTANVGACECWAVTVDWGRLVVKGIRPVVLVHGFMSSASTWSTWESTYGPDAGLPVMSFSFGNNHGSWLAHASEEAGQIAQAKQKFGVQKVNIVGHSKGGLDSRAYLALGGTDVNRLVMLGTPNGGSPLADIAKAGGILYPAIGLVSLIGEPALTELTVTYMNLIGNRVVGANGNTSYYTVAGDWHGLLGFSNPLILGSDDGVVGVGSVETLPYTTSLGHTSSFHTAMTSGAGEWNLARGQVVTTAQAWPTGKALTMAEGTVLGGQPSVTLSNLTGATVTGGPQTHDVAVAAGQPVTLGVLWGDGNLSLTLTSPSGQSITGAGSGVEYVTSRDATLGLSYNLFRLLSPEAGTYRLNVTSDPGTTVKYLALGAVEGGAQMSVAPRSAFVVTGQAATLEARLVWNGATPVPMTVEAKVQQPSGQIDTLALVDDGSGVYTGSYTPAVPGTYGVAVTARSSDPAQPLERIASTAFQTLSSADRFTGTVAHKGLDTNGDGLYDKLSVTAGVSVATPGVYLVMGQLTDSTGRSLVRTATSVTLGAGAGNATLLFDGLKLGESGFSGDMVLTDLALVRADGGIADFKAPAATLSGYSVGQFQRPRVRVLPGISDQGIDTNGDGQFETLLIKIPVDVLYAGYYDVNARLMDGRNAEIAWAGTRVYLAAGASTVTLSYSGVTIGKHGVDGPYLVRDFSLYSSAASLNIYELYSTTAYSASQFQGYESATFASLLTRIDQYRADGLIDNDGLAQSLKAKVKAARDAAERGNSGAARNTLEAVLNEIAAQEGKHIDPAAAAKLKGDIQILIGKLP